jgi:hypothetical protein
MDKMAIRTVWIFTFGAHVGLIIGMVLSAIAGEASPRTIAVGLVGLVVCLLFKPKGSPPSGLTFKRGEYQIFDNGKFPPFPDEMRRYRALGSLK